MTQRTRSTSPAHAGTPWESYLVLGSITILAGLAVADRFAAWLIGEFPTWGLLWHIRFEYLRPIAVYHNFAELNWGTWSPFAFSMLVIAAAALIAGGALSRLRLARAVSYHLLFGAAATLAVLCFDRGLPIQPRSVIGTPSETYVLLGGLLTAIAATLCLRIHAEYIGWNPWSSRMVRRLGLSITGMRSNIEAAAIEMIQQLSPAPNRSRAVLAFTRADRRRDRSAQ
ncbi:hypothetical protein [Dongia deserti]|uniref:hypothetical protein n=1 Tax=Dongia deserti TaxID=2268030 RepID=UPI000E65B139|nr:hypothetical protein [Dongia deserti]